MTTKRTRITRTLRPAITPETLAMFKKAKSIKDARQHDIPEEEGGQQRDYLNLIADLHEALGRRPWQECVMSLSTSEIWQEWWTDDSDDIDTIGAVRLRRALESAA